MFTFWQVLVLPCGGAAGLGWGPGAPRRLASAAMASRSRALSAGLLVGGAAGAELGDGAAVLGLGGELADPGGHGGVLEGGRAAGRGAASRG